MVSKYVEEMNRQAMVIKARAEMIERLEGLKRYYTEYDYDDNGIVIEGTEKPDDCYNNEGYALTVWKEVDEIIDAIMKKRP